MTIADPSPLYGWSRKQLPIWHGRVEWNGWCDQVHPPAEWLHNGMAAVTEANKKCCNQQIINKYLAAKCSLG